MKKTLPGIPRCGRLRHVPGSSLGEHSRTGKPTWTLLCHQHSLPAAPQSLSYHWPWQETLGIIWKSGPIYIQGLSGSIQAEDTRVLSHLSTLWSKAHDFHLRHQDPNAAA